MDPKKRKRAAVDPSQKHSAAMLASCASALGFNLVGCQAVGEIFKAGIWVGVVGVLILLALAVFLLYKLLA